MPTDKRQTIEKVFLTADQFTRLLAEIPDHYKLLVMTLYGTGMRWGEVTALTPSKFNFEAKPATVRVDQAWKQGADSKPYIGTPKTRRSLRTITLPGNLANELRQACEGLAPDDLLFTGETGVALRSGPFHTRVWQPAVKAANLGVKPRVHDLRHSHASALIAAGVSLPVVQRRLGHESIQTTIDVYGHLAPDAYAGATEAAEAMLTQALPQIES
jgi:integrase